MPPTNFFQSIWAKKIRIIDRFYFSLILLVLAVLYYRSRYISVHVPFTEYQWEVYTILFFLVSFIVIDFWGDFILKCWLTVSGLVGKLIFYGLMIIVYFLILSPVFFIVHLFTKKKEETSSNWSKKMYINKDYQNMG